MHYWNRFSYIKSSTSILEELKTIQTNFSQIHLTETMIWRTIRVAEPLSLPDVIGSFKVGKYPVINLISYINLEKMLLNPESNRKVLIYYLS